MNGCAIEFLMAWHMFVASVMLVVFNGSWFLVLGIGRDHSAGGEH